VARLHAHPCGGEGAVRFRESVGDAFDALPLEAGDFCRPTRLEVADQLLPGVDSRGVEPGELPVETTGLQDAADHRNEQEEVRSRPDHEVFVCDPYRLGPPGIDDDDTASPLPDPPERAPDVRLALKQGHPLGHDWIRAQKQRKPRAIRVRLKNQVLVSEHPFGDRPAIGVFEREHVEGVGRSEGMAEGVGQRDGHAVRGVPPVGGDGAGAVGVANGAQSLANLAESPIPAHPFEADGAAAEGMQEALRVVHVVGDPDPLDAGVAPRDGMIRVGPHGDQAAVLRFQLEPTERLACPDLAGGPKCGHDTS
jgi:hypothetical protein